MTAQEINKTNKIKTPAGCLVTATFHLIKVLKVSQRLILLHQTAAHKREREKCVNNTSSKPTQTELFSKCSAILSE